MGAMMQAAQVTAPGHVEIVEIARPEPAPGEVRVHLEGCGVCASNLPPWEGRPWFSYPMEPGGLGHEGWGRVDAIGAGVTQPRPGDRVALLSQHAYAEYDTAPAEDTVPLPATLDGQPFPAEPLGCAWNVLERSAVGPEQTVAIVGVGFLGALLVRLASHAGARVLAVTRRQSGRDLARSLGADVVIPMDEDRTKIIERVGALTNGQLCERVIECVGKQEPLDLAAELTGVRGRLVIAGYHQDGLRSVNLQQWNWRGLDVINAHERDPAVYRTGMRAAVRAVAGGALDPSPLYTHTFPLARLADALEITRQRPEGFVKALVLAS